MAFCTKCGAQLPDNSQFCTTCGTPVAPAAQYAQSQPQQQGYAQWNANPNTVAPEFDPQDVQKNKWMAVLAYFGILVLVPLFVSKDSRYARFHTNQGLVLLIFNVVLSTALGVVQGFLSAVSPHLSFISSILSLGYVLPFVLFIMGVVNAAKGRAKELPVIGSFRLLK